MGRWWLLVLTVAMIPALCPVWAAASSQGKTLDVGTSAPQFTGADLAGNPVNLSAIVAKSKAVLVNFWGLRCGACLEACPYQAIAFDAAARVRAMASLR